MGGRVKVIVSGGSSLAEHLEDFFEMVGQVSYITLHY
jgi:long-subunit acyl-CoA synthetase (AMP-forming)